MAQQESPNPTKRERRDAARAERVGREQAAAAAATRRKRLTQLGALLGVAVVVVVVAVLVSSSGGGKKKASSGGGLQGVADTTRLIGGIPQKGITLGRPDAPATIVEFADPQCPFCKQYALDELPAIVQTYVRTGKAKMELRFLTFLGPDSVTAARALEAAGQQGRFWQAVDLMYRNQGEENSGYVTNAFLTSVLQGAGADARKALAATGTPAVAEQLAEAQTLSSRYGVNATPTLLVGSSDADLRKDAEQAPTAAGVGKMVDAVLAAKGK